MEEFKNEVNDTEITIDLKKYLALFWQYAWLIILVGVVAALAAFVISRSLTPVYEAKTTVLVNEAQGTQSYDYQTLLASERLTKTYAQMMTKNPIIDGTIRELGLAMEPQNLRRMITVNPVPNTQLIDIVVESTNPEDAVYIADTLVSVFRSEIENVQIDRYAQSKKSLEVKLADVGVEIEKYTVLADSATSESDREEYGIRAEQYKDTYDSLLKLYDNVWLSEAQMISSVAVVEPAVAQDNPVRPRVMMNTLLAGVVGVLLAAGLVLVREAMDDTIHTPDEVKSNLNLPVLGGIANFSSKTGSKIITMEEPRSPISEGFRSLRENVRFASIDDNLQTLLVTSPEPGEGKSTVASNLAVVFAQSGFSTILLDADLRKPMQHTIFDIKNRYGLSDLLFNQDVPFDKTMFKTQLENLYVVPSGTIPPNPSELIASKRMKNLLAELKGQADLIILDSPPIQAVTDSVSIAPEMTGVLLVVQPGKTHVTAARLSVEQLKRAKAKVLGAVLNPLDMKRSQYAYRYAYKNSQNDYKTYFD